MAAELTIDLTEYFTDLDGDEIEFSFTHTGLTGATVELVPPSNRELRIVGPKPGSPAVDGTVTVTAQGMRDGEKIGDPVSDTFAVDVVDARIQPRVTAPLPDRHLFPGRSVRIDLDRYFGTAPDKINDYLTYTVTSTVGTVELQNFNQLVTDVFGTKQISRTRYLVLGTGTQTEVTGAVKVVATNTYGQTAEGEFELRISGTLEMEARLQIPAPTISAGLRIGNPVRLAAALIVPAPDFEATLRIHNPITATLAIPAPTFSAGLRVNNMPNREAEASLVIPAPTFAAALRVDDRRLASMDLALFSDGAVEIHDISGLGTTVWVADGRGDRLLAFNRTTGAAQTADNFTKAQIFANSDAASSSRNVMGVHPTASNMFVLTRESIRSYVRMFDRTTKVERRFQTRTLPAPLLSGALIDRVGGIWSPDGTTFYLPAGGIYRRMYVYEITTLTPAQPGDSWTMRVTDKEFDLDAANGHPGSCWSDGTTIWVADGVDHKLYAYVLSTGARDANKDLDDLELAAVGDSFNLTGVWGLGDTIWVSGTTGGDDPDLIQAYRKPKAAAPAVTGRITSKLASLPAGGSHFFEAEGTNGTVTWTASAGTIQSFSASGALFNAPSASGVTIRVALLVNGVEVDFNEFKTT